MQGHDTLVENWQSWTKLFAADSRNKYHNDETKQNDAHKCFYKI